MIKRFLISISYLFVISFVIGVLHFSITKDLKLYIPIVNIYIFNFILGVFGLLLLNLIYEKFNDKVGYTFLGIGVFKMALSISFLMPLIESNFQNKVPDTLNFFFCYFIFLIIESVFVIKLLNKKQ